MVTETMIKRAARALYEATWGAGTWGALGREIAERDEAIKQARAAIAALREPTDAMVEAADRAMYGRVVEGNRRLVVVKDGLAAAIDAALKDAPDA